MHYKKVICFTIQQSSLLETSGQQVKQIWKEFNQGAI